MSRIIAITLLIVAALLAPSDAAAVAETRNPTVEWPLPAPVLRVENRTNGGWAVRKVLREIERRTPVDVRRGRCRHVPTEVCVTVREGSWSPEEQGRIGDPGYEWAGLSLITGTRRDVYLNNYYDSRLPQQITAHEFGHVLGLAHHKRKAGVLGSGIHRHFSRAEISAVNRVYQK